MAPLGVHDGEVAAVAVADPGARARQRLPEVHAERPLELRSMVRGGAVAAARRWISGAREQRRRP
jgi:hypothetical protein